MARMDNLAQIEAEMDAGVIKTTNGGGGQQQPPPQPSPTGFFLPSPSASPLVQAAAFDNNDWNSLISGDSLMTFKGLSKAIDDYSGYDGGKLAVYDLGIAYLNTGDFDKAIETLSDNFSVELYA